MQDKITSEKLKKYFEITEKALKKVKENVIPEEEDDASEIIEMATNYVNDAHHFEEKEDLVNAYGALNYAHGWIDCGVRLGIFDVNDDTLFTVK